MNIRRVGRGEEALWLRAVEALVPDEDRGGRLASPAEITQILDDSRCYLYLAFLEADPIGLLSAYRVPDAAGGGNLAYLYSIDVGPLHRGRGAGKGLVNALLESCREDGVRLVWAGTDVDNLPARRVFEATGAELEGEGYAEYEWEPDDDDAVPRGKHGLL